VSEALVRDATPEDAASLVAIYAPYVAGTAVSFEEVVPGLDEFRARIALALERYAWLVAEMDGRLAGYAYATSHRARSAYRYCAETSAYVGPGFERRGLGRRLYAALLPRLAERGYCTAYAGIALPNDASVGLHRAMGFTQVGVFRRAGFKFGRWHDVSWWQLALRDAPP
jgi:phosphinothricin acetyltransferase